MNAIGYISLIAIFAACTLCESRVSYPDEPTPPLPNGPIGKRGKQRAAILGTLAATLVSGAATYIMNEAQDSKRNIKVVNEMQRPVWVRCRDKDVNIGDLQVPPGEAYSFDLDRSFWGVTHFWCNAWYNGESKQPTHFPAYNEGAPNANNLFALRDDGVYLKAQKYHWEKFRERIN